MNAVGDGSIAEMASYRQAGRAPADDEHPLLVPYTRQLSQSRVETHNGGGLPGPIALFIKNFEYGGIQRSALRLANKLHAFGHTVHVISPGTGPLIATLSDGIRVIHLASGGPLTARWLALRANPTARASMMLPLVFAIHPLKGLRVIKSLTQYLRLERPGALVSATASLNVVATLAKRLADVSTRLVLTEHITAVQLRTTDRRFARRHLPELMRRTYRDAAAIVGISSIVASDLRELLQVPTERVRCIFNPAIPDDVRTQAAAPIDHPWFAVGQPPVVLSAGRASRVKDYEMLLHAFAHLRAGMAARLVILTSAVPGTTQHEYLDELRDLAQLLGIAQDFEILDFQSNPFAFMARAGVFATTSISEGFGNVAAEALAAGCPVVGTCTKGTAEVLGHGHFGRLVPIGDTTAMAAALQETLSEPRDSAALMQRGNAFTEEQSARSYEALFYEVCAAVEALPN